MEGSFLENLRKKQQSLKVLKWRYYMASTGSESDSIINFSWIWCWDPFVKLIWAQFTPRTKQWQFSVLCWYLWCKFILNCSFNTGNKTINQLRANKIITLPLKCYLMVLSIFRDNLKWWSNRQDCHAKPYSAFMADFKGYFDIYPPTSQCWESKLITSYLQHLALKLHL